MKYFYLEIRRRKNKFRAIEYIYMLYMYEYMSKVRVLFLKLIASTCINKHSLNFWYVEIEVYIYPETWRFEKQLHIVIAGRIALW